MTNNKCATKFISKFAYIDNNPIHIDDYDNIDKEKLKCIHGHKLIPILGEKNIHHFRHKHSEDTGGYHLTYWHLEWQSNFLITEKTFHKINNSQIKLRKADVEFQNSNIILEFQHSKIEELEVNNRKNDYKLHNKEIIWIIDGNDNINITHLEYSDRIYLEFNLDWKYKSFIDYDYIFIDKDEFIYKIYPKKIKSNMIDVDKPFTKKDFINYLNNNDEIIHLINDSFQSTLYVKQLGAGTGKTYGIFQMLQSQEFEHYRYFIMVTKQHSAKSVMFSEFNQQIKDDDLEYIIDISIEENKKKYTIKYTNKKTNSTCQIIIATIDSLMYCLGDKDSNGLNKFEKFVNSIIDGYIEKNNSNNINFASVKFKLNKEVCLISDETQDLTIDYAKAIIQIMRNKYIDSYVVGDKLQSIAIKDNAFTYLIENDFSYINKHKYENYNICRRFSHIKLINFVNAIIPFEKYKLTQIDPLSVKDNNNDDPIIFITAANTILANETDEDKINSNVEQIMEYYKNEVSQNNYKPNDFLIVTPFTKKNPLVNALEIAIHMYWIEKYNNDNNDFERYAIFHKSEDGTSINLSESENATRIVSIHTSKGDGRPIVFLIGMTEKGLQRFSTESNNLVYDSLIHVAITRMKKKLYIRLENNGDDICQKITKYMYDNDYDDKECEIVPVLKIYKNIKYNHIIETIKTNNIYEILKNVIINKTNLPIRNDANQDKRIIDTGHHNIRYATMLIYLFIKIINYENKLQKDSDIKKQIQKVFHNLIKSKIHKVSTSKDFNNYLKDNEISVLKISNNGRDYNKYYDIIYNNINNVKEKLINIIKGTISDLCPYECIILYYMIQVHDQGKYTDISISELYNITDIYNKSYNKKIDGHDNCLCKTCFDKNQNKEENSNITNMKNYLSKHYEDINNISKIYNNFLKKYSKINWLINHDIIFNSNSNNDFKLYKKFNLIGYDSDNVFIFYIKPQFNNLNYNEILLDSIFDIFLLKSIKQIDINEDENTNNNKDNKNNKDINDLIKFNNKKIKTIIFSLDNANYYPIEWNNINNEDLILGEGRKTILDLLKEALCNKYKIECKYMYNFYKYWYKKYKLEKLSPEKIIEKIINDYKKNKYIDKMPPFILTFFQNIDKDIETACDRKSNILKNYNNKDYFIDKLNKIINKTINNYLDIDDNLDIEDYNYDTDDTDY